jgi:uncharacterized protein DUF3224
MRRMASASTRLPRWLLALSLVLAASLLATDQAAASAPFEASGTFVGTSSQQSNIRPVGCCVVFFDQTSTDTLSGTLDGSDVYRASCQVRTQSGAGVCVGTDAFTGTVAGRTGTLQIHLVAVTDTTGAPHGNASIVSGTGGLANLHGHLTAGAGTYSGQFLFAP